MDKLENILSPDDEQDGEDAEDSEVVEDSDDGEPVASERRRTRRRERSR
jgi:hypothetical protein